MQSSFFGAQFAQPGGNSFVPNQFAYSIPGVFSTQPTMLPQAFQTMTLPDPTWNMATSASSHLADNAGILTSVSNSCIYPSAYVCNGASIHVTHTGHSLLYTYHKPLKLNHILVTPHLIKNFISVRKFLLIMMCLLSLMLMVFL